MIKPCNERIMITINANVLYGLQKIAKAQNTTVSRVIESMCIKKSNWLMRKILEDNDQNDFNALNDISTGKKFSER